MAKRFGAEVHLIHCYQVYPAGAVGFPYDVALPEIARETVRIHAPYTHVPYHQRVDRGFFRFVNNDHCLLSTRSSLFLPAFVAPELAYLPMAQTVWYVPTALDQWNQLLGGAPGHYGRRTWKGSKTPPFPAAWTVPTRTGSTTGSPWCSRAR